VGTSAAKTINVELLNEIAMRMLSGSSVNGINGAQVAAGCCW
jgi:hypothetical protein